jgi:hypothetical protein
MEICKDFQCSMNPECSFGSGNFFCQHDKGTNTHIVTGEMSRVFLGVFTEQTAKIAVFVFEKLKRNLDKTVLVFFVASALTFFLAYVIKMPIINIVVMVLAILTANGASSMMWTEYCLSLRKTGMVSSATGYLDFLSYAAAAIANVIFADAATSIGWGSLILVWCALMVLGVIISLPFEKFKKEKANATNI